MTVPPSRILQDVEEQVLQTFARLNATTLPTSALFRTDGTFSNADIARALTDLEGDHKLLIRYTWGGTDWVTLTTLGRDRRALAGGERIERRRERQSVPPEIIYEHPHPVADSKAEYSVLVLGVERTDGTWAGWLEFVPTRTARRLRTGQETSQPNRESLMYWATGLEDLYFEGALKRAAA